MCLYVSVVDVYQEWCGPCKAMISNFKRIKNEVGDDLLHFAVVCNLVCILLCHYITEAN